MLKLARTFRPPLPDDEDRFEVEEDEAEETEAVAAPDALLPLASYLSISLIIISVNVRASSKLCSTKFQYQIVS
jgi:hypothetical protein